MKIRLKSWRNIFLNSSGCPKFGSIIGQIARYHIHVQCQLVVKLFVVIIMRQQLKLALRLINAHSK
jgi:hypothetical protein